MAKTPIAIPNITVNGDDYWDSHKSQYNALIGGDVEPFKIDLSNWKVDLTPLYAWTSEDDLGFDELPTTVYTTSETVEVDDKLYDATHTEISPIGSGITWEYSHSEVDEENPDLSVSFIGN